MRIVDDPLSEGLFGLIWQAAFDIEWESRSSLIPQRQNGQDEVIDHYAHIFETNDQMTERGEDIREPW